MPINSIAAQPVSTVLSSASRSSHVADTHRLGKAAGSQTSELREVFDEFVGETFFRQLLKAMRKSVGQPAYFHGGRAEEVFQGQLDQKLAEQMAKSSASQFTGPMFELFTLTSNH